MNLKREYQILSANGYVSAAADISGIAFSIAWLVGYLMGTPIIMYITAVAAPSAIVVSIITHKLRNERCLANFIRVLHALNHEYRNVLGKTFSKGVKTSGCVRTVREKEEKALRNACQRIASTYSFMIRSRCVVTVKLIENDQTQQQSFCDTFVRSGDECSRDDHDQKFEIGGGKNTAFDIAMQQGRGKRSIAHFHSADLSTEENYMNERRNWAENYMSTIVVPIQFQAEVQNGVLGKDLVGFLCVDTIATHRLNNHYHVELLAAFADQMYNFISLMRQKYQLPSDQVMSKPALKETVLPSNTKPA